MARLPRPYIPLLVRVQVALRQVAAECEPVPRFGRRDGEYLSALLWILFEDQKCELHHQPSLLNRQRIGNDYDPPANDPEHLVYLLAEDHVVETRVRGLHGQHSDLALARKRKRQERKLNRPRRKWASRPWPTNRNWR